MCKKIVVSISILLLTIGCNISRQSGGELKVELEPSNVKVKVTTLEENRDAIKLKIEVEDYGTRGPKSGKKLEGTKSLQVGVV